VNEVFDWPFVFMVIGGLVTLLAFLYRLFKKPDDIISKNEQLIEPKFTEIKTRISNFENSISNLTSALNNLSKQQQTIEEWMVARRELQVQMEKEIVAIRTELNRLSIYVYIDRKEIILKLETKVEKMSDLLIAYFSTGNINKNE
jgi:F0F1-type ATP synthase membrane subunit b/b'